MSKHSHTSAAPKEVPPANPPFSLILLGNGSLAVPGKSIGGGDLVFFKIIRLCNLDPDLLIPVSTRPLVETRGKLFLTLPTVEPTLVRILILYSLRILQGIWKAILNRKTHDIALASSPFGVDIIPLWFWKARNKGAIIFHLLPERTPVNLATRIRFGIAAIEQRVIMKVLSWACDFLVAGNEFTAKELQARIPGKPVFILPAGFDAAVIDRVPDQARDPNLACFVGRLVSQKGIFDLVKIMAAIAPKRPEFRLVIAGTGPEGDLLKDEIRRAGLSNIELAGFVSEEQKFALLKRASHFFFPSYEEGWGIALAEALYCECRCVCYELPPYRSIFADFPAYARLGDWQNFVEAFLNSGRISPEQKQFILQYDDPAIVRKLVEHLGQIARGT
jgi:glycosyltransferase involved in cell wall biosynthesis